MKLLESMGNRYAMDGEEDEPGYFFWGWRGRSAVSRGSISRIIGAREGSSSRVICQGPLQPHGMAGSKDPKTT